MDIFTLDFETYYSKEYSLSKMTTEAYIRDQRFEVIGVSVQVNEDTPVWFSGTMEKTKKFLKTFNWENCAAIAHNAMFDMAILNWRFNIRPKKIIDTLSMSRPFHMMDVGGSLKALATHYEIGAKGTEVLNAMGKKRLDFTPMELAAYGRYCCNDTAIAYKLFGCLMVQFPLKQRYEELNLIDLTIRMFTEPVLLLDIARLEGHAATLVIAKERLMSVVSAEQTDLRSNPKFADILKDYGVPIPMKISQRTGRETYAFAKTDEGFKALLEHDNPYVQALAAARAGVKSTIEETRTQRFLDIASRTPQGKLPIPLRYYAAHTGRWGGTDKINLQNLPSRENKALKESIMTPDGYKLIDCDSSQIEARILAWLSGQDDLMAAFENKEDVYIAMASTIFGEQEISVAQRFVGKTTILGAGYSMGAKKFKAQLAAMANIDINEKEAKRIIDTYRRKYPMIPTLWKSADKILSAICNDRYTEFGRNNILKVEGRKGICLPNGFYISYPNLRYKPTTGNYVYDKKLGRQIVESNVYGGKVIENICQALAKIIIGYQLLMISKKYKVAMTVHDSGTSVVLEEEVDQARGYIELCMRTRPKWGMDLPLDCESGVGFNYGDCA